MASASYLVGVDIGGTFTDCVVIDADGTVTTAKSPSTPGDFAQGMLNAMRVAAQRLGLAFEVGRLLRDQIPNLMMDWAYPGKTHIQSATRARAEGWLRVTGRVDPFEFLQSSTLVLAPIRIDGIACPRNRPQCRSTNPARDGRAMGRGQSRRASLIAVALFSRART